MEVEMEKNMSPFQLNRFFYVMELCLQWTKSTSKLVDKVANFSLSLSLSLDLDLVQFNRLPNGLF